MGTPLLKLTIFCLSEKHSLSAAWYLELERMMAAFQKTSSVSGCQVLLSASHSESLPTNLVWLRYNLFSAICSSGPVIGQWSLFGSRFRGSLKAIDWGQANEWKSGCVTRIGSTTFQAIGKKTHRNSEKCDASSLPWRLLLLCRKWTHASRTENMIYALLRYPTNGSNVYFAWELSQVLLLSDSLEHDSIR